MVRALIWLKKDGAPPEQWSSYPTPDEPMQMDNRYTPINIAVAAFLEDIADDEDISLSIQVSSLGFQQGQKRTLWEKETKNHFTSIVEGKTTLLVLETIPHGLGAGICEISVKLDSLSGSLALPDQYYFLPTTAAAVHVQDEFGRDQPFFIEKSQKIHCTLLMTPPGGVPEGQLAAWTWLSPEIETIKFEKATVRVHENGTIESESNISVDALAPCLNYPFTVHVELVGLGLVGAANFHVLSENEDAMRTIQPIRGAGTGPGLRRTVQDVYFDDSVNHVPIGVLTHDIAAIIARSIQESPEFLDNLILSLSQLRVRLFVDLSDLFLEPTRIDSFEKAEQVEASELQPIVPLPYLEDQARVWFAEIINELFIPSHSPAERSDLFTRVVLNGKKTITAFIFKGRSYNPTLTLRGLGSRGDQMVKLFTEPAELFVIQANGAVDSAIFRMMRALVIEKRVNRQHVYGCIINGVDTGRILRAYGKI